VDEIHLVLAEELERLAAGYRKLVKSKNCNIDIQDISFILNEKIKKGKAPEIKALLKKYGAQKLVEVKSEDYKAFYEEVKEL
jgi:ABC-type phosphate transport system auxiliary subunit